MKKVLLVALTLLCASHLFANGRLEDIRAFDAGEKEALKTRYPVYKDNDQLFSTEQFEAIAQNKLAPVIALIILHPEIKLTEPIDLVDFARTVVESGFSFAQLEPRILKGMKEEMSAFHALAEAIDREGAHQWRKRQVERAKKAHGPFLQVLGTFGLNQADYDKVEHVYGACIAYLLDPAERAFMKPSVCDPMEKYPSPRNRMHGVAVRTTPSSSQTPRVLAYRRLVAEGRAVAGQLSLDAFERIKMSKCVAEQALRFFNPKQHPFKSLSKLADLDIKAPEEAFFMHSGLCANFSSIAYNFANELGLKGRTFLAKKGLHTYIEFEIGGGWYHMHPFNNQGRCDITKF